MAINITKWRAPWNPLEYLNENIITLSYNLVYREVPYYDYAGNNLWNLDPYMQTKFERYNVFELRDTPNISKLEVYINNMQVPTNNITMVSNKKFRINDMDESNNGYLYVKYIYLSSIKFTSEWAGLDPRPIKRRIPANLNALYITELQLAISNLEKILHITPTLYIGNKYNNEYGLNNIYNRFTPIEIVHILQLRKSIEKMMTYINTNNISSVGIYNGWTELNDDIEINTKHVEELREYINYIENILIKKGY